MIKQVCTSVTCQGCPAYFKMQCVFAWGVAWGRPATFGNNNNYNNNNNNNNNIIIIIIVVMIIINK